MQFGEFSRRKDPKTARPGFPRSRIALQWLLRQDAAQIRRRSRTGRRDLKPCLDGRLSKRQTLQDLSRRRRQIPADLKLIDHDQLGSFWRTQLKKRLVGRVAACQRA